MQEINGDVLIGALQNRINDDILGEILRYQNQFSSEIRELSKKLESVTSSASSDPSAPFKPTAGSGSSNAYRNQFKLSRLIFGLTFMLDGISDGFNLHLCCLFFLGIDIQAGISASSMADPEKILSDSKNLSKYSDQQFSVSTGKITVVATLSPFSYFLKGHFKFELIRQHPVGKFLNVRPISQAKSEKSFIFDELSNSNLNEADHKFPQIAADGLLLFINFVSVALDFALAFLVCCANCVYSIFTFCSHNPQ